MGSLWLKGKDGYSMANIGLPYSCVVPFWDYSILPSMHNFFLAILPLLLRHGSFQQKLLSAAASTFADTRVEVTSEGRPYFGAALGNENDLL